MNEFETFKDSKVLITGGAGLIGSTLAGRLVGLGADVTIVDSLVPEYGGNLHNLRNCRNSVNLNISDVRDPYSMAHLVQDRQYLFNLAGQTSHMDSMADPFTDLQINGKAQLSILEACRKSNPKVKIVFASTRQLYGRPQYLPVDEKHPVCPVDINGVNKLAGEMYHLIYNDVYGIPTCVFRLTNTYGPHMRIKDARQTFLGIWIRQVLQGKPFEVWGGEQLRDFTYVEDCVDAMLLAALNMEIAEGKCYNLGGESVISLRELAEMLIKAHGSGKYTVMEYPEDRKKIDIGDYYCDDSLFRKELGWAPGTPIRQGLENTLHFFSKNMKYYL